MTISKPLTAQSVDELKLPPHINLRESGLRQLERINVLQPKAHKPTHVTWGTRPQQAVPALITLFSFVSLVTVPDHVLPPHATFSDHVIKHFEELNEHYDCENIHSWISLNGNLTFSHQDGIYGFKFP